MTELSPADPSINVEVVSEGENSTSILTVMGTEPADSGNYFCRAVNPLGSPVDSANATVMVYGEVLYSSVPNLLLEGHYLSFSSTQLPLSC